MYKSYLKNLLIILGIVLIMVAVTFVNQNYIKNYQNRFNDLYSNELSKKILNNDLEDVDYDYILKDLNSIDDILIEQVQGKRHVKFQLLPCQVVRQQNCLLLAESSFPLRPYC